MIRWFNDSIAGRIQTTALGTRAGFAIAGLAFLAYLPSLWNGFVWDDLLYAGNTLAAQGRYHRPLVFLSFELEHRLAGRSPSVAHAVNGVLHLVNTALLMVAAQRAGLTPAVALAGAAIFALHPIQTEAVAYVSGRTDLLMTAGALLSVIALLGSGSAAALRGVVAAAAGALAMLAKETGFALVVLSPYVAFRRAGTWRERAWLAAPLILVATILLTLRPAATGLAGAAWPDLAQLAGAGWAAVSYGALLASPVDLQVDRLTPLPTTTMSIALGLFALAAVAVAALWGVRQRGPSGLWSAWTVAFYLPAANLFAIYPAIATRALFSPEHNLYAPLAGIGMLAALALQRVLRVASATARRRFAGFAVLLLLAWTALSAWRVTQWRDEATLFGAAAAAGSPSPRVWFNYGNTLLARRELAGATRAFETAARLAPGDAVVWMNLGVSRQQLGDYAAAEDAYRRAARLAPDDPRVWENLGTLFLRRSDPVAARDAFTRALSLDPTRTLARRALDALGDLN
jgi:Tfp pilus assembly protein PilF